MRIVTLNVRNPSFDDGPNAWPFRRDAFFGVLRRLDPDVLCLQETHARHLEEILRELPGRVGFGVPREDHEYAEMCGIVVRETLPVACSGTEWLCETPDVPGTKGWGAACPRVVTWVDLGAWTLFNVHLDHVSGEARTNGVAQVVRLADQMGKPALIAGDLNAEPSEPALAIARAAGFVDLDEGGGPTFDGFGGAKKWEGQMSELERSLARLRRTAQGEPDEAKRAAYLAEVERIERQSAEYRDVLTLAEPPEPAVRIDYLLARGPWRRERAWVERDAPPYSDHRAVVADLSL